MIDILELMRENVKKINDSEQVKFFREVIEPSFKELIEHTETMYKGLEDNIYRELSNDNRHFEVVNTIISKKDYGYQSLFFSPICQEDKEDLNSSEILKNLGKEKSIFLEKLYIPLDNEAIENILNEGKNYTCTIFSESNSCDFRIRLELNTSYSDKEELLYKVFTKNNIRWKTINMPFSKKIIKVYLEKALGDFKILEKIEKIEYKDFNFSFEQNMIPVWNVFEKNLSVSAGVYPANDKINYHYKLFSEDMKKIGNNILPFSENINIKASSISETGDLKIICDKDNIKNWQIFCFKNINNQTFDNINLYRNHQNNIFDKLKHKNEGNLKTKAEIRRLVNLYGGNFGISLKDIEISSVKKGISTSKNLFIINEESLGNYNEYIILYLELENIEPFSKDIIDFILAEVQLGINNYQCRGVIL